MIRTGIGYDVHPFAPNRRLVLGGVEFAFDRGLLGHSDADVLLHAIADAVLGAAAQGDIGRHFPTSDPAFRDADSLELLAAAAAIARAAGFTVVNIDATVIAEEPKIGPKAAEMVANIALALEIHPTSVNIKATTNEGLGFIGRAEGIAALAIATVSGEITE
jgi:2-C-methyl-D-erythritol 2,4-cyclodiphosphate synthase